MKNWKLEIFIVVLCITGSWNHAGAANESSPAPPLRAAPTKKQLKKSFHEQATADAWAAFGAGDNETAIVRADQCIIPFRDSADHSQATLEADKVTLPEGTVSEAKKKRIAQYQILHDVATCFLIKGWAEEKLGRTEEARKAYTEARKYTLARSSMPTGESFWCPAEKASESLAKLR